MAIKNLGRAVVFAASSSDGTKAYMVVVFPNGKWSCTCPATVLCRHIKECKAFLDKREEKRNEDPPHCNVSSRQLGCKEDATRARCFACGQWACTACSQVLAYYPSYGRKRICLDCIDQHYKNAELFLNWYAYWIAGYDVKDERPLLRNMTFTERNKGGKAEG